MAGSKHRLVWNTAHTYKVCKYCGLPEVKLTSVCPKEQVDEKVKQDFLNGVLEYNGKEWVKPMR